ncbi:class I SAM-dependent methyltransferase [Pelomyxa schiedti]|nr:class I SAM-dependent methyltransferase [Pelomyxa schiedti]
MSSYVEEALSSCRVGATTREQLGVFLSGHRGGLSPDVVYTDPAAFSAFCSGGGNVPLYDNVSSALAAEISACIAAATTTATGVPQSRVVRVLDVGAGLGDALVPALEKLRLSDEGKAGVCVDLVEPIAKSLDSCCEGVSRFCHCGRKFCGTAQAFMESCKNESISYDIVISSFAMQHVPPHERPALFEWLRGISKTFCLVEFDVTLPQNIHDRQQVLFDKYEMGLQEYRGAPSFSLVSQGFLMPMLVSVLSPDKTHISYEQSTNLWVTALGNPTEDGVFYLHPFEF